MSLPRSQAYSSTTPPRSEEERHRCGASCAQPGRDTRGARQRACHRAVTSGGREDGGGSVTGGGVIGLHLASGHEGLAAGRTNSRAASDGGGPPATLRGLVRRGRGDRI